MIEAYRLARSEIPDLRLARGGIDGARRPRGLGLYREIQHEAAGDEAIKLFTNLTGVGNIEVNAFQQLSSVVLQKSIREGFGLVVSEALWKGTPVVAGRAGGIPAPDGRPRRPTASSSTRSTRRPRQWSVSFATRR